MKNKAKAQNQFLSRGYESFERKTGLGALLKWALLSVVFIVAAVWLASMFGSREIKGAINHAAAQIGMAPKAMQWSTRAETAAAVLLAREKAGIAGTLLTIMHPMGREPSLMRTTIAPLDDRVLVEFRIAWKGGLADDPYETSVKWEISKIKHVSAHVMDDSAMFPIDNTNMAALDDYFRTKMYSAFIEIFQASEGS